MKNVPSLASWSEKGSQSHTTGFEMRLQEARKIVQAQYQNYRADLFEEAAARIEPVLALRYADKSLDDLVNLYKWAIRRRIGSLRRDEKKPPWSEHGSTELEVPVDDETQQIHTRVDIERAWAVLDAEQRALIHATFWDGQSLKEIAEWSGLNRMAVWRRIQEALQAMREALT